MATLKLYVVSHLDALAIFVSQMNIIFEVSRISVHRKADAALGVVSRAFCSFRNSTLEMLARQQGQAIMIWRNTPACGVAET